MGQYQRNLRTLARCQAAYDKMQPPEYYDDGDCVDDDELEWGPEISRRIRDVESVERGDWYD